MRQPLFTQTIPERVACVKPGRSLLLKVSVAVIALIGLVAIPSVLWADAVGYNLNKAPLVPRLVLAAVLVLAGVGLYKSIREAQVSLKLEFWPDRLVLTYEDLPGLWREGTIRQVTEIPYRNVTSCLHSGRRMRLSLRAVGYTQTRNQQPPRKRTGGVSFSTLEARDVDFDALLNKYGRLTVTHKD